jgi:DNA polymerase-4
MKLHLDLDSFFISAERIKNKELLNIPAAVGGRGDPFIFAKNYQQKINTINNRQGAFIPSVFYNSNMDFNSYFIENGKIRGIIITASYEAREMGIYTGMSIREALDICPKLKVVAPNHLYYHQLSYQLKKFLEKEIPLVEQFSIDEFFADVSGWIDDKDIEAFLSYLQKKIEDRFKLPISIGAAKSKWTAKLATSYAKPYGTKVIKDIEKFLYNIPIQKFPGIGRGYLKRLKKYRINYLHETKEAKSLFYEWKKPGITLYKRIWGIDNEPVLPKQSKKSIGISRTIDAIKDRDEVRRRIIILCRYLFTTIFKLNLKPTYYSLSIKYEFGLKTKAHINTHRVFSEQLLKKIALKLFKISDKYPNSAIIRVGLRCGKFYESKTFDILSYKEDLKFEKLSQKSAVIRNRWGVDKLKWGVELT